MEEFRCQTKRIFFILQKSDFSLSYFCLDMSVPYIIPHVLHNSKFLNLEVRKIDFKGEKPTSIYHSSH